MPDSKPTIKMEGRIAQNNYEFLSAVHSLVKQIEYYRNQIEADISSSVNNFITQKLISDLNTSRKNISISLIDFESSTNNFRPEFYLKAKNGKYGLQFFLQMVIRNINDEENISGKDINLSDFNEISNKLIFETFDTDYEVLYFIKHDGYPLRDDIKESMIFTKTLGWITFKYRTKIYFCRIIDKELQYIECRASSLDEILNALKKKIYELAHKSTDDNGKQFLSDLRNLYRKLNIRENRKHASENTGSYESNTEDDAKIEKVMYFY